MLKRAPRTAMGAWSPAALPVLQFAAGTAAGAVDFTFSASGGLEIFNVDVASSSHDMQPVGAIQTGARFHKVVWSPHLSGSEAFTRGIIAAGMDNCEIHVYNPSAVVASNSANALVTKMAKHVSPVHALDFNPSQHNLLASGAAESDLYIWDLNAPNTPTVYSPGEKLAHAKAVSCVAWNRDLPFIMGSTTLDGISAIWDLKAQKPVIQFRNPSGASRYAALAWHPLSRTQLVTVSESDSFPLVEVWDLRNAMAPMLELRGHTKGVLSASWCPQDPGLLLSCGKDNRTLCWNPLTGEQLAELPASSNWAFETLWCPRIPGLLSVSSFDGRLAIYSVDGEFGAGGVDKSIFAGASESSFLAEIQAGAGAAGMPGAQAPAAPRSESLLKRPPKWFRRPAGASFGFGGRLVCFGPARPAGPAAAPAVAPAPAPASQVRLGTISTEQAAVRAVASLLDAESRQALGALAQARRDAAASPHEQAAWALLAAMADDAGTREPLLAWLGFNPASLLAGDPALWQLPHLAPETGGQPQSQPQSLSLSQQPSQQPDASPNTPAAALFGASGEGSDFVSELSAAAGAAAAAAAATATTTTSASSARPSSPEPAGGLAVPALDTANTSFFASLAPLPLGTDAGVDGNVVRAALLGDWRAAVALCVRADRLADAFVCASAGGATLLGQLRTWYLLSRAPASPLASLLHIILSRRLDALVARVALSDWRAALAFVLAYCSADECPALCSALGRRLLAASNAQGALACFLIAGDLDEALALWSADLAAPRPPPAQVVALLEKVCVLLAAIGGAGASPAVSAVFVRCATLLAAEGALAPACALLARAASSSRAVLLDRVYFSGRVDVSAYSEPPFPFDFAQNVLNVDAPAPEPAAAQVQQAQPVAPQPVTQPVPQPVQPHPLHVAKAGASARPVPAVAHAAAPAAAPAAHAAPAPAGAPGVLRPGLDLASGAPISVFDPSKRRVDDAHPARPAPAPVVESPSAAGGGGAAAGRGHSIAAVSHGGYGDAPAYPEPTFAFKRKEPAPAPAPAPVGVPSTPSPTAQAQQSVAAGPPGRAASGGAPAASVGAGVDRRKAPDPPAESPKSAPGDTSRVAAEHMPIVTCIKHALATLGGAGSRTDRKKLEQVEKKVLVLLQKLNDGELSPAMAQGMLALCQAITEAQYDAAMQLQTQMIAADFQDWLVGVKFLVQMLKGT